MLGLEEIRDAVEGVVIDEDRAKQRLFRLDIMRRQPECGLGAAREAGSFGEIFDAGIGLSGRRWLAQRAESVRDRSFCAMPVLQEVGNFWPPKVRLPLSTPAKNFKKNGWTERAIGLVILFCLESF